MFQLSQSCRSLVESLPPSSGLPLSQYCQPLADHQKQNYCDLSKNLDTEKEQMLASWDGTRKYSGLVCCGVGEKGWNIYFWSSPKWKNREVFKDYFLLQIKSHSCRVESSDSEAVNISNRFCMRVACILHLPV